MSTQWADPPEDKRGGSRQPRPGKYAALIKDLRANPGKWALMSDDGGSAQVTQINQGVLKGFTKGEFRATLRRDPDRHKPSRGDIYVRYVGGDGQAVT